MLVGAKFYRARIVFVEPNSHAELDTCENAFSLKRARRWIAPRQNALSMRAYIQGIDLTSWVSLYGHMLQLREPRRASLVLTEEGMSC